MENTRTHTHTHTHTHTDKSVRTHPSLNAPTYIHTHTPTNIHIRIHPHTLACIHAHTHMHILLHKHTHTFSMNSVHNLDSRQFQESNNKGLSLSALHLHHKQKQGTRTSSCFLPVGSKYYRNWLTVVKDHSLVKYTQTGHTHTQHFCTQIRVSGGMPTGWKQQ